LACFYPLDRISISRINRFHSQDEFDPVAEIINVFDFFANTTAKLEFKSLDLASAGSFETIHISPYTGIPNRLCTLFPWCRANEKFNLVYNSSAVEQAPNL
jgi:hypothetical protein